MIPIIAIALFAFGFCLTLIKAVLHAMKGDFVYLGICLFFYAIILIALKNHNIFRDIWKKGGSNCSKE